MPTHNMVDYDDLCESFEWSDVFAEADWDAPGEINVAHEYPREIEFRDELPKTVTGKIRRTELREETD